MSAGENIPQWILSPYCKQRQTASSDSQNTSHSRAGLGDGYSDCEYGRHCRSHLLPPCTCLLPTPLFESQYLTVRVRSADGICLGHFASMHLCVAFPHRDGIDDGKEHCEHGSE